MYSSSPGVGDAEARIHAVLVRERSADTGAPAPRRLAAATVPVEDRRFYHHGALDLLAIGRVVWSTLTFRPGDPGGSTIALHLSRILDGHADPFRTPATAVKLERRDPKSQILEMYLNAVYCGDVAYGASGGSVARAWGPDDGSCRAGRVRDADPAVGSPDDGDGLRANALRFRGDRRSQRSPPAGRLRGRELRGRAGANRPSRPCGDRSPLRAGRHAPREGVQGPSELRRRAGLRAPARRRSLVPVRVSAMPRVGVL